ncbi:MAG: gluconate:H+ symporter [Leadbetterella sp.]|nr:gluconate:H+ symporter [Leadbetterella sp.]
MTFLIILLSLAGLIVLISYFRINAFLAFLLVSIATGLALGIPAGGIIPSVEKGIGGIMGGLTLILVLGAMLGKLVAESGAADRIAAVMVRIFGEKYMRWGLTVTGFIVGIPLFYGVGFVLLVPLIFSIVYKYRLPAVYIGLPMLAALSVTHGFVPPHPSPVALVTLFNADMGLTLIYGLLIAIPAIILGGPVFSRTLKGIQAAPTGLFRPKETAEVQLPGTLNSFVTALFPVFALILFTALSYSVTGTSLKLVHFLGNPSVVMILALLLASFTLALGRGKSMTWLMKVYEDAVKDIAMILLIIAGSGIFKQVMEDSGVSLQIASGLQQLRIHPIILAWLITAVIRGCVGSATVAALTSGGVLLPLVTSAGVDPNLMVLAIGAGSLMFSHVNDSGFWLFKEYFGISIRDTLRSWSVMEAIVSLAGLAGVGIMQMIIN